jgi:hypothetical protein
VGCGTTGFWLVWQAIVTIIKINPRKNRIRGFIRIFLPNGLGQLKFRP